MVVRDWGRGDRGREDVCVGRQKAWQVGEGLLLVRGEGGEGEERVDPCAPGEQLEEGLRGHGKGRGLVACSSKSGEVFGCEVGGDETRLSWFGRLLSLLLLLLCKHHQRRGGSRGPRRLERTRGGASTGAVLYLGSLVLEPS